MASIKSTNNNYNDINISTNLSNNSTVKSKAITPELLSRVTKKNWAVRHNQRESLQSYLKRASHLQLDDQGITTLAITNSPNHATGFIINFHLCASLKVLYLHNNLISKIQSLDFLKNLTSLYLNHNTIGRLEGLAQLKQLEKLYVQQNQIARLESFAAEEVNYPEKLTQQQVDEVDQLEENDDSTILSAIKPFPLKELYISNQNYDKTQYNKGFSLSLASILSLANTLTILDLSYNAIQNTQFAKLYSLTALKQLKANHNSITDLGAVLFILSNLIYLAELDLTDNPFYKIQINKRCREAIVKGSRSLKLLDNKPILESEREFLTKLQLKQENPQQFARENPPSNNINNQDSAIPQFKYIRPRLRQSKSNGLIKFSNIANSTNIENNSEPLYYNDNPAGNEEDSELILYNSNNGELNENNTSDNNNRNNDNNPADSAAEEEEMTHYCTITGVEGDLNTETVENAFELVHFSFNPDISQYELLLRSENGDRLTAIMEQYQAEKREIELFIVHCLLEKSSLDQNQAEPRETIVERKPFKHLLIDYVKLEENESVLVKLSMKK
jgi:Leucine-rich repeat (LRR) protein